MSEAEEFLSEDLGDHSLTDYNLCNDEEDKLLADDMSDSVRYERQLSDKSQGEVYRVIPGEGAVPLQLIAGEVKPDIGNVSIQNGNKMAGVRDRFPTERNPNRMPQHRVIPDSLDKVMVPRPGFGPRMPQQRWRLPHFHPRFNPGNFRRFKGQNDFPQRQPFMRGQMRHPHKIDKKPNKPQNTQPTQAANTPSKPSQPPNIPSQAPSAPSETPVPSKVEQASPKLEEPQKEVPKPRNDSSPQGPAKPIPLQQNRGPQGPPSHGPNPLMRPVGPIQGPPPPNFPMNGPPIRPFMQDRQIRMPFDMRPRFPMDGRPDFQGPRVPIHQEPPFPPYPPRAPVPLNMSGFPPPMNQQFAPDLGPPQRFQNFQRPMFEPNFVRPRFDEPMMPQVTVRPSLQIQVPNESAAKVDEFSLKPPGTESYPSREQEVRMLPLQLPADLASSGFTGKKVLINPHFKGTIQPPLDMPKSLDEAAERFIAEQRSALAKSANRTVLLPSDRYELQNTVIEIKNDHAVDLKDDELLRKQEQFINDNRAGLRRRMRSRSPPPQRRSPARSTSPPDRLSDRPPPPDRHSDRAREVDGRPTHRDGDRMDRPPDKYDEEREYERRVREQQYLRERVLRAKEVRRRRTAHQLSKQAEEREREQRESNPNYARPQSPRKLDQDPRRPEPDRRPETDRRIDSDRRQEPDYRRNELDYRQPDYRRVDGDYRRPNEDYRRPDDYRNPDYNYRRNESDYRREDRNDYRRPEADYRKPDGDYRKTDGDYRKPDCDYRKSDGDYRKLEVDYRRNDSDTVRPDTDVKRPDYDSRVETENKKPDDNICKSDSDLKRTDTSKKEKTPPPKAAELRPKSVEEKPKQKPKAEELRSLTPEPPAKKVDRKTPPKSASSNKYEEDDDALDLILDELDGILSDDDKTENIKVESPPKPKADLRNKITTKPAIQEAQPQAKPTEKKKIVYKESKPIKKASPPPVKRAPVSGSGTEEPLRKSAKLTHHNKIKHVKPDVTGSSHRQQRQRIVYQSSRKEGSESESDESLTPPRPAPPVSRRVVLQRGAQQTPSGNLFTRAVKNISAITAKSTEKPNQSGAKRIIVQKRTAEEPKIEVEMESDSGSQTEDDLSEDSKVTNVYNLPHGMTDTRLWTLAGTNAQSVILNKEQRSAKITFKTSDGARIFVSKFNNKLVAASRLTVTLM